MGLDLATQLRIEQQELRLADLRGHFLPRARGVDVQTEAGWRFVGREAALRDLVRWLSDAEDPSPRIVTGGPGSGKSAVIGRLVVLSDPDYRRMVPAESVIADTRPLEASIATGVHARGLTSAQVLAALSAQAGVAANTPADLLREMRGRRLTVAIDAIDEALDPEGLAFGVLRPLVEAGPAEGLRLLLGSRPHLVGSLGLADPGSIIDLDDERYSDPESIYQYVLRRLRSGDSPPYASAAPNVIADIARAVADAAGHSFLVALIATRTLLSQPLPDPTDPVWRASLPGTAAEAMHADLETRLRADADRARDLLRPLAFAAGAGLPWENMWAPLASRLSGRSYTDEDLIWLRRQAGSYVVEAALSDRSVYRLYHAALAEYLRQGLEEAAVHEAFTAFLIDQVPVARGPDWGRAHPYTLAHLATHAQRAGLLDDLLQDPGYLVNAIPAALLAALPSARAPAARKAGVAYQRAVHQFRDQPERQRASYLEFAARIADAPKLAAQIDSRFPNRRWSVPWTHWPPEYPHQVFGGQLGTVADVLVVSPIEGKPVVVSIGADAKLRTWDLTTADPLGVYPVGTAPLVAVKAVRLEEQRIAVAVLSADGLLYLWDLTTAEVLRTIPIVPRWRRRISAFLPINFSRLACLTVPGGRHFAFVGDQGSGVTVWELPSGRSVAVLPPSADAAEIGYLETLSGRVVLVARTRGSEYWAFDVQQMLDLPVYIEPDNRPFVRLTSGEYVNASLSWEQEPDLRGSGLQRVGNLRTARPGPEESRGFETTTLGRFLRLEFNDVTTGQAESVVLAGHTGDVTCYDLVRIAGADVAVTGAEDGTIRRWDIARGGTPSDGGDIAPPDRAVIAISRVVSIRLDGGLSVGLAIDATGDAALWSLRTGSFIRVISRYSASAIAVAHVGGEPLALIAGGGTVAVIRVSRSDLVRSFGGGLSWPNAITSVVLPDGSVAAVTTGHGRKAAVWDLGTGQLRKVLAGHRGWSSCVTLAQGAAPQSLVLTGGFDNRVNVWDISRRWHRRFRIVNPWTFLTHPSAGLARAIRTLRLPNGRTLVLVATVDGMVRALEASEAMRRARRTGAITAEIATSAALTNGLLVVITATDGVVRIWDATAFPPVSESPALCEINVDVPVTDICVTDHDIVVLATPNGLTAIQLGTGPLADQASRPLIM
jgi:WD40 repeat protein